MESSSTSSSKRGSARPELPLFRGNRVPGTLPREFYARDTLTVARELLGKVLLVRSRPDRPLDRPEAQVTAGRIVETEAYHGSDPASHSSRGETPRCSVMFGEPGVAYVYFIYGMYEMLNFVTERKGYPGAVLIRALEPLHGEERMARRRKGAARRDLTSGPGKLCAALGIRLSHNGQPLQGPALFVYDDGFRPGRVLASGRVGISLATEEPWRYFVEGNPFVSRVAQNKGASPHG
jgi:DNA-3-methyladenine glycosylase